MQKGRRERQSRFQHCTCWKSTPKASNSGLHISLESPSSNLLAIMLKKTFNRAQNEFFAAARKFQSWAVSTASWPRNSCLQRQCKAIEVSAKSKREHKNSSIPSPINPAEIAILQQKAKRSTNIPPTLINADDTAVQKTNVNQSETGTSKPKQLYWTVQQPATKLKSQFALQWTNCDKRLQ